jgi:hypothetical protein
VSKYCPNPECSERSDPGRPAEYRLDVSECPSCGTPLLMGPAPHTDHGHTVVVARCASHFHSQSVQHILKSEGIPHYLSDSHASSMYGNIINVRVMVPEEHASRARMLLDEQGTIESEAPEQEKRSGLRPLTLLILLVLVWAFIEVIRMMFRA